MCYVDTAERSSGGGAGWLIVDVGDRSTAVDQIPWCFVLQTVTPTDHDSQLVLHAFRNVEPVELIVNVR